MGSLRTAVGSLLTKGAGGDESGYVSFHDLELGERIGVGAFASVYVAESVSRRGRRFAEERITAG